MKKYITEENKEAKLKTFRELKLVADELGCSQAQLALAWAIKNNDVSVCLLGASKPAQIEENIKALDVASKWTPDIEKKIEVKSFSNLILFIDHFEK